MSEKYKNLKVKDLQELLQKSELPHTGKKEELIERLVKHNEQVERELDSLEEEFGDLEEYKGEANPDELTTNMAKEAKERSTLTLNASEEAKKDESEKPEEEKPKFNFKFTPITFDKTPSTPSKPTSPAVPEKPASPAVPERAASPAISEKSVSSTASKKPMTNAEKALERAKRFGVQITDTAKKDLRAQRFGTTKKVSDEEALKQRSARFGTNKGNNDTEALKKRAERFGTNKGGNDSEVLKKRAERFGLNGSKVPVRFDAAEEDKKRKRAERFAESAKKQRVD
ncbi:unnamed protein product [Rhizopus stolonifer]